MRARWRLARLVLDRDRAGDLKLRPELLQRALADTLGDPGLRVAYPLGDGRYVDVDGRQALPAVGATGRAVTEVRQAGELVALIEHDEALNEQQRIAATVAEVADVAIENARMHARLRAQIEQIRTSRFRVSAAALEERRLIERNLHDGAQQQFFAVLALLGLARHQLDASGPDEITQARGLVHRAHGQLQNAIESLRDLTQGIYPTALTEHGLAAAIEGIADTSGVPIAVDIPGTRWPEHVETTAYFLIAEAITNAYRHAAATQVIVRVGELDGWVRVEVSDDGRGGATFRPGRGPGGMLDRVNTIGGSLTVRSEPGAGTAILAKLPMEMLIS
jgi:signal transduction histidine kinase